ncbi:MAG: thiopurine S-methyltransferase [Rheinheimera sp.]|nr:thiopurine S-methyltransferase [Rheinheimera sp.]
MDPAFWLCCWQQDQLGWQLDAVHPLLSQAPADWLDQRPVFVPLCGKSLDLMFLAQHAAVVGVELSELACTDFFRENKLAMDTTQEAGFVRYQAANISLYQGDFFALTQAQAGYCQRIYDRAALIALPAPMRQLYVRQLRALLPEADMLLLSLEYPAGEKQGPPFSVPAAEITELFDFATVQQLQQRDLTGQGFARRRFDTSVLIETCWRIQWN